MDCSAAVRHVFHRDCVQAKLMARWQGAAIDFAFLNCPLCARPMRHIAFTDLFAEYNALYRRV